MLSAGDCVPRLLDVIPITCHERSRDDIALDVLAANTLFRLGYDFVPFWPFILVDVVIWLQIPLWPGVSMCWA
jgi:hypothetical protein